MTEPTNPSSGNQSHASEVSKYFFSSGSHGPRPVLAGMDDHVCPRVTCWWWYVMEHSDARADPLVTKRTHLAR